MTSAKYDNLVSWARSNGAIIPETLIFPSEPYGHCRTTAPVPQGTQLFHLPHKIIITPEVARRKFPPLRFENVHIQLCTFVASQRREEGFWKDYFDTLPETFSTPLYFSPEELKVLEGTNLAYAWKDVKNIWKKEWERASIIVDHLPWEDYLWAATVVASRSFPSRLLSEDLTNPDDLSIAGNDDPVIIPILDMLNHRPNQPVTWLKSPNTVTYVAEVDYPADSEIYNNYGAKGNEELLLGYGFCVPNNPHDCITLSISGDASLYRITKTDLAPNELVETFRLEETFRERFTDITTKASTYRAYTDLLKAIRRKLCTMGWHKQLCPTPAGRNAELYFTSQRDLLLASFNHVVKLMDDLIKEHTIISINTVFRQTPERRKKRVKRDSPDEGMIDWLLRHIAEYEGEESFLDEMDTGQLDEKQSEYLQELIENFYGLVDWLDVDGLRNIGHRIYHKCGRIADQSGLNVTMEQTRMAWMLWDEEHLDVYSFPDVVETFKKMRKDKVGELEDLMKGEVVDTVILEEEIEERDCEFDSHQLVPFEDD